VVMFTLVDVVLVGVEGWVGLGVVCRSLFLYGVYFRVFRLCMTPLI